MPDIIADGMTKVSWVTTIATPTAPTATELNAGIALETLITPDGYGITSTVDRVDTGSLASVQDSEVFGRKKDGGPLTFKYQGDAVPPFSTFAPAAGVLPAGFLVTRFGVPQGTAFAAAQKVDVMPAQAGYRQRNPSTKNEVMKFVVEIAATGPVQQSVAVV